MRPKRPNRASVVNIAHLHSRDRGRTASEQRPAKAGGLFPRERRRRGRFHVVAMTSFRAPRSEDHRSWYCPLFLPLRWRNARDLANSGIRSIPLWVCLMDTPCPMQERMSIVSCAGAAPSRLAAKLPLGGADKSGHGSVSIAWEIIQGDRHHAENRSSRSFNPSFFGRSCWSRENKVTGSKQGYFKGVDVANINAAKFNLEQTSVLRNCLRSSLLASCKQISIKLISII
jgi:hypothetical protein